MLRIVLLLCALPELAGAAPRFVDRAPALGITHRYTGGWEYFVGGGVAVFDCNGDHMPEIFAAGGAGPAVLLRNVGTRGGRLAFKTDTPASLHLTGVIGAYPLDIDGDGRMDLAVLRVGRNLLLKGGPACSFSPFPASLGFQGGNAWTTAFSATWEKGQVLPTLAFGNYVDRTDPKGPFEACDSNVLLRPKGKAYTAPLALEPGFCTLSMLFSDWGHKGRQDLRISNDRHYYVTGGQEQMWAMGPKPRLYTAADGWKRYEIWGMGIASRDLNGDGIPEVFLTSMADQKLQSLAPGGGPRFVDERYARGTTAQRPYRGDDGRPSTGWQAEFGDVNNDGRDDLFIAKGNVDQMPGAAMHDPNNLLMQGPDGRFKEAGGVAGVGSMARSRGAALTDLNLDGQLDLVVVNRRAPMEIFQNLTTPSGNWLLLDIEEAAPNRRALGGWIEVKAGKRHWWREITVGGGQASGHAGLRHFGLGRARSAEIRVTWPDGTTSSWVRTPTNRILQVHRQQATLTLKPL